MIKSCYKGCNRFAYLHDKHQENPTRQNLARMERDMKYTNFVPMYDTWCLNCDDRGSEFKCGKCRAVWFCSVKCQKESWKIHKRHCGRELFIVCATCGCDVTSGEVIECGDCPVKYCSEKCKRQIHQAHVEYGDCAKFASMFLEKQTSVSDGPL